jgi:hypothetical protein
MSFRNSGTWWSQKSLSRAIKRDSLLFANSSQLVRKESCLPQEKHTFFPGSDLAKGKLSSYSDYLFQSESNIRVLFDIFINLLTICLAIAVPYSISYFSDLPYELYLTASSIFLLDIIINFNTSYSESGKTVTDHVKIAKKYLNSWLFIDLLAATPIELFFPLNFKENSPKAFFIYEHYPRLFFLLKISKIFKARVFLKTISMLGNDNWFFLVIKISIHMMLIFIPLHWANCMFNSLYSYEVETSFNYNKNIRYSNQDRYLIFAERIVQTLISVGYGDFNVASHHERIFLLCFMVFSSAFFGFLVGEIEEIIERSQRVSNYFRNIKNRFRLFQQRYKLNRNLNNRVTAYMRHLLDAYKSHSLKDEDIIDLLSTPLKQQIFFCTKGFVLLTVPFFEGLSRTCTKTISYHLTLKLFGPNDMIFLESSIIPEVFFINSGSVQIFHQDSSTVFTELKKNSYFGELTFLLRTGRTSSAKSSNFSELLSLNRFDVDKVLQRFPKDCDLFLTIVRNLKNYGVAFLKINCYLCGNSGHLAKRCEKFIFKANVVLRRLEKKKKLVNLENSPKSSVRRTPRVHSSHCIHNTTGYLAQPELMFASNKYLIKKSQEFSRFCDLQTRQLTKVIKIIEEEKSLNESRNSVESLNNEKCFFIKTEKY